MNILKEADKIIHGPRRKSYGPVEESFQRHALAWTAILLPKLKPGATITPEEATLMMAALKLNREVNNHNIDNLVDVVGYTLLLQQLTDGKSN